MRTAKEGDIPADLKAQADSYRAKLVEAVASADDKLIEKYLSDEPISQEELETALKRCSKLAGNWFPFSPVLLCKTSELPCLWTP